MRKKLIVVSFAAAVLAWGASAHAGTIGLVGNDSCLPYTTGSGDLVYFCDADVKPTGTGVFNPFLRTNPGGNKSPSSGWNTDAAKNTWDQDNDADDPWTSALLASSLGTSGSPDPVNDPTGLYVVFTVDINQQGNRDVDNLLSLAHFQLFSCTSGLYTNLSAPDCTSIFNMFGGTLTTDPNDPNDRPVITTNEWVDFDYRNHNGSGSGDINIFIPLSVVFGMGNLALLDGWGGPTGTYPDNDGFQEWRAQLGVQTCPDGSTPGPGGDCDIIVGAEPASMLLFGLAAIGSAYRLRRRTPGA